MNGVLLTLLAMLLLLPQGTPSRLPYPPKDGLSFDYTPRQDSPQLPYILSVGVDGSARFIEFSANKPNGVAARPVQFKMSSFTLQRLLSAYAAVEVNSAEGSCETHLKGIASTGKKLLTYYRDGRSFACAFDYANDSSLNRVADAFQAIAETLQIGEKLQHDLRYDRLGLDADMDALVEENAAGRAIEVQSIAATLQNIIDDDRVLERVRRKAARLLEAATTPATPQFPPPIAR